jgi:hypothetical protein
MGMTQNLFLWSVEPTSYHVNNYTMTRLPTSSRKCSFTRVYSTESENSLV